MSVLRTIFPFNTESIHSGTTEELSMLFIKLHVKWPFTKPRSKKRTKKEEDIYMKYVLNLQEIEKDIEQNYYYLQTVH